MSKPTTMVGFFLTPFAHRPAGDPRRRRRRQLQDLARSPRPWTRWPPAWPGLRARVGRSCSMPALASASTVSIGLQEIRVTGAAGSCSTWRDRYALGEVATDVARAACAGRAVVLDAGAGQLVDRSASLAPPAAAAPGAITAPRVRWPPAWQ
ncbi:hypothetical protein [Stenotrophomonas sp. GD04051]|uniref:hypothetical protein n=1 Tax=Stenotrophomonas sp. GD04051 TaxID=2975427 RepID=UPI00244942A5|nr:hypothetical protein [Stenotrophomonas sp. GD04051]MDH0187688.1 hypothetical protein [Stenotrophomonas sp. GD04051]